MEQDNTLSSLMSMIATNKITELEAERLLNAWTRAQAGVPTGLSQGKRHEDAVPERDRTV